MTNEQEENFKGELKKDFAIDDQKAVDIVALAKRHILAPPNPAEILQAVAPFIPNLLKSFKPNVWLLVYRFFIIFSFVGSITYLTISGKLDGCQASTLIASVIGYILGKTTFFS